jgi:hypothetical protein
MHFMKKKKKASDVFADDKEFDAVLTQLLQMDPIPMKKLKTSGRKGPKGPLIRRKP